METAVFQIIRAQVDTVLGVDGDGKDNLDLQVIQQAEYEKKVQVYYTALASYITLGEQGRVVLHTKTETEVTLDDGSNESS